MIKDFSLNGTLLEKGTKLEIEKGFSQKGDINQSVANTLKERGVAEDFENEPTNATKPKPTDNRPSKK